MMAVYLAAGVLFGFILSRVGATSYDLIMRMFLFTNLHLMGVIGMAVLVAMAGIQLIRRLGLKTIQGGEIEIKEKSRNRGNIVGGLLFGVGWALSGSCPGTVLSQIGEGKLDALFTCAGLVAGTYLFGALQPKIAPFLLKESEKK